MHGVNRWDELQKLTAKFQNLHAGTLGNLFQNQKDSLSEF
jgi:hypothetical protein